MIWKNIAIATFALVLAGCAQLGQEYKYTPTSKGETPATIDYIAGIDPQQHTTIFGQEGTIYGFSVSTYKINNTYVNTSGYASSKSVELVKNNRIYLSPGRTAFTFHVGGYGNRGDSFEQIIDVKPGEHYKLKVASPKVMVTDSRGSILKEVTVQKTKTTYVNGLPVLTEPVE